MTTTLSRQLGFYSATALVISNMIGTGIFATTGFMAGDLGAAKWIILIWLLGGIFALCGALSYAELSINFPKSGGEYVYLREAYSPAWGFISGWISFFAGFSAPIAAAAIAFSAYAATIFPGLKSDSLIWRFSPGGFTFEVGGVQMLAASLIALCALLNYFGIGRVARIQNFLTGTKLVVLFGFIVLALIVGQGSWDNFQQSVERTSSYSLPIQLVISTLWVMFSYSGWNAATYVAEEVRAPEKTLPLALAAGTLIVMVIYIALNLIFIYSTPLESMKGVISVGSLSAVNLFGEKAGNIFAILMAVAIISTVNAMVTIGPRIYFAMARDRAFFPSAAKLHPRWQTPIVAIVCQAVCAIAMTFTPFPNLVLYIGFSLTIFSTLGVASVLMFRKREGWQSLKLLSIGYPLIPALYLIAGTTMVVYGLIWQPAASLASMLTIISGVIGWFYISGSGKAKYLDFIRRWKPTKRELE
jgi:basic amino acid/polyamine antiporter, APA family